MRPPPTSHRRSQDPDDSKMGFVTPAMYAGLGRVSNQSKISSDRLRCGCVELLHGFPFVAICEVCIRKSPLYETPQYDTAARSQRTCGQHVTGYLTCRPIVSEEDDALASYERVKQQDDRVGETPVGV